MTEETKEAKVPAGMTIKKPNPEQNQQPKGLPTKEFDKRRISLFTCKTRWYGIYGTKDT